MFPGVADLKDYDSRAVMWRGPSLSLDRASATGLAHDRARLSAIYDVAHGAGLAVVFPAWMKHVMQHDVARFAQFAARVWNVDYCFEDPARTAREGIRRLEVFFREIGMPVTLKELGVKDDRLEEMARHERGPIGSFVKLGKKEVRDIYTLAL
jgi:alcohol dehydrogenase YqhD (iron-dependent ADH family)